MKLPSLILLLAITGSFSGTWACGRVADEAGADGGSRDGTLDSPGDVVPEGRDERGTDATRDSVTDTAVADVASDAPSGFDASDAGVMDAPLDSASDVAVADVAVDAPSGSDAGDAGVVDAGSDAPPCPLADDSGPPPPSCAPGGPGMTNCGPGDSGTGTESCCTSLEVCGGTFYRFYDDVAYTSTALPATVSSFRLDKYEITLGRFRQFVNAVLGGWLPPEGSGKHAYLNNGSGLIMSAPAGVVVTYEPGWDATDWNGLLPATLSAWTTGFRLQGYDWTSSAGGRENNPIGGVSWFEAYAFCIWDGGFLPSLTEWNYAATGGGGAHGQRVYPWSIPSTSATMDCSHANYNACGEGFSNVGSRSPAGDGAFGQTDLAGNVREWSLDEVSNFFTPCVDCAAARLPAPSEVEAISRMWQGGSFAFGADFAAASFRELYSPVGLDSDQGARCARAP